MDWGRASHGRRGEANCIYRIDGVVTGQECMAPGRWLIDNTGWKQRTMVTEGAGAMQTTQGSLRLAPIRRPAFNRSVDSWVCRNEKTGAEVRPGSIRQFQFPE